MKHVVILGAGLGGLWSALTLAKQGFAVTLLESSRHCGGRSQSKRVEDELQVNMGAHALYLGGPAYRHLHEVIPEALDGVKPDPNGVIWSARGRAKMPFSGVDLLTLRGWSLAEKAKLAFYLARIKSSSLHKIDPALSFQEWFGTPLDDSQPTKFIQSLGRLFTYTGQPGILSAASVVRQFKRALGPGVVYLKGGWQSMVTAMTHQTQQQEGLTLHTGVKINDLTNVSGTYHVQTNRGAFLADHVIFATPPDAVSTWMGVDTSALCRVDGACLDLVWEAEQVTAPWHFGLGLDEPMYALLPNRSLKQSTSKELLQVVHYLSPGERGDATNVEQWLSGAWFTGQTMPQPQWRRFATFPVCYGAPCAGASRPCCRINEQVWAIGDWVDLPHELQDPPELLLDATLQSAAYVTASLIGEKKEESA